MLFFLVLLVLLNVSGLVICLLIVSVMCWFGRCLMMMCSIGVCGL